MSTRIHIWHDQTGKIIAVGKPAKHMIGRVSPMAAHPGQSVISVDMAEDVKTKDVTRTHFVDVVTGHLKRRT